MKPLSYKGLDKVLNLLNEGIPLNGIVDRYGRPLREEALEYFLYHKQHKRYLMKKAENDIHFRTNLAKLRLHLD